jgi:hypothetical protein
MPSKVRQKLPQRGKSYRTRLLPSYSLATPSLPLRCRKLPLTCGNSHTPKGVELPRAGASDGMP